MLDYFFDAFPPYDQKGKEVAVNMKVYEPSNPENPDASLVMLATRTGDAEVVDYVLDRATLAEVECAYRYAQAQVRQARFHKPTIAGWKAVQRMLQEREGFAPPPEIALRHHPRPPQFPREGKTQYKGRVLAKGPRNAERAVQFSTDAPRADTSTV